ncbi:hypothetical protein C8Q75DRAFT_733473 [Abortiporus biennis]|nr:hypothetical protein C8Q75DRAFT_733473 [Abortiporus biennis]
MWVGNVSSDATEDELWRFFNHILSPTISNHSMSRGSGGVNKSPELSFSSSGTSGGRSVRSAPLRLGDPQYAKLLAKQGKAGSSGMKGKLREREGGSGEKLIDGDSEIGGPSSCIASTFPSSLSELSKGEAVATAAGMDAAIEKKIEREKREGRTSIGKKASSGFTGTATTTSSILTRFFLKRYFILKSWDKSTILRSCYIVINLYLRLTWILDSQDVFLIFGVNKTKQFYRYARTYFFVVLFLQDGWFYLW